MPVTRLRPALFTSLLATALLAQAQPGAEPAPEIALAPSRFELPMRPGSSQTVVVNVISSGGDGAKPLRLLASLGDWTMAPSGEVLFPKPGVVAKSAVPWILYSPVEMVVQPGQTAPIRVTIDVPKDAAPGDHTAVLFVEERPPDIKTQTNRKQITFHFRMAAIFYVMVPPHQLKGALTGLEATATAGKVTISPTLKNEGNVHVRPLQSYELLDGSGTVIASQPPSESSPILAGGEFKPVFTIERALTPGEYKLRYRVDFRDGAKVIEGHKTITVAPPATPAPKKKSR